MGLAVAQFALGNKAESDAALADLIQKYESTAAFSIAIALAYHGDADRAYEWLDKSAQYRESVLGSAAVYLPVFTNIHTDRRWLPFLRKHGMAPEQLAAIRFDMKVPK